MNEFEKLALLESVSGETDKETLLAYLRFAAEIILRRMYPYGTTVKEVPKIYSNTQVEIAGYLLDKRGAVGEIVHNENGVNRTYESAEVPESMLRRVIPYCGVIGK